MTFTEILSRALQLTQHERAALAQRLIASLDEDEVAEAWAELSDRRYRQVAAGDVDTIPAGDVIADARRAIQ